MTMIMITRASLARDRLGARSFRTRDMYQNGDDGDILTKMLDL